MPIGTAAALGLGIGGAAGVGKGVANAAANERARKLRAATIRYSPWTGMGDPGMVEKPGVFESSIGGLGLGASLAQGLSETDLFGKAGKAGDAAGKATKAAAVGASTAPDVLKTSMAAPVEQNFGPLAPQYGPYQNPIGGFTAMAQMARNPSMMRPGAAY